MATHPLLQSKIRKFNRDQVWTQGPTTQPTLLALQILSSTCDRSILKIRRIKESILRGSQSTWWTISLAESAAQEAIISILTSRRVGLMSPLGCHYSSTRACQTLTSNLSTILQWTAEACKGKFLKNSKLWYKTQMLEEELPTTQGPTWILSKEHHRSTSSKTAWL